MVVQNEQIDVVFVSWSPSFAATINLDRSENYISVTWFICGCSLCLLCSYLALDFLFGTMLYSYIRTAEPMATTTFTISNFACNLITTINSFTHLICVNANECNRREQTKYYIFCILWLGSWSICGRENYFNIQSANEIILGTIY